MLHSPRFRFHVGLLHEHVLTKESERHTREGLAVLRCAKMDRGGSPRGGSRNNGTEGFEEAASEIGVGVGCKAFVGSSQTVQTVLLELKEKGPTVQDTRVLYADISKRLGQAASILFDSMPPAIALALVESILASVNSQAQAYNGVGGGARPSSPILVVFACQQGRVT